MAVCAFEARRDLRDVELLVNSSGVAVEAYAGLPDRQTSSHGFFDRVRRNALVARRCGKRVLAWEVADEALEEVAVFLEHPGLRVLAEDPVDGKSQCVCSVSDGVSAVPVAGLDSVGVCAQLYGEGRMRREQGIGPIGFHGVAHGGSAEGVRYPCVACCAGG